MVDGARGYPFMLQLVGAHSWRLNPDTAEITVDDATRGVARARRRLGALVHEPALSAASDIDKSFLLAMAQDDGPSKMADIQYRLDVDVNYASQYRLRLIAAELIYPTRRGYVDFALPYLREYLRQHSAIDARSTPGYPELQRTSSTAGQAPGPSRPASATRSVTSNPCRSETELQEVHRVRVNPVKLGQPRV